MKICAIICEYNPFHSGHKYQLEAVRAMGASNIVCIMSGQFTQSAEPAFCDKGLRAECAVLGGADAVIELPTLYATASAGYFALGGVKIASEIKGISSLAMGATAKPDVIKRIADIKIYRAEKFRAALKRNLDAGKSYNAANTSAIVSVYASLYNDDVTGVISEPNNMLCVEYICAISDIAANVEPVIIERRGAIHNSADLSAEYISATAVRENFGDNISKYVPYKFDEITVWRNAHAPNMSSFEHILAYSLKRLSIDELSKLRNCSEGMEYLLTDKLYADLNGYMDNAASRRYGKKRLRRLFLDATLDIDKNCFDCDFCTRLLACKNGFDFSILPMRVKTTNSDIKKAAENADVRRVSGIDERAVALYNTVCGIDGGYYNYSLVKV